MSPHHAATPKHRARYILATLERDDEFAALGNTVGELENSFKRSGPERPWRRFPMSQQRSGCLPALGNTSQLRVYRDGATWFVTLPLQCGQAIDAKWQPDIAYVVRIREKGVAEWSLGFETSITGCTFTDLKPDTDYEIQIRSKTARGESAPTCTSIRTNPPGGTTNIIPFPKR